MATKKTMTKAPLKAPQVVDEYNKDLHTFILNLGDTINIVLSFDLSAMTVNGKVNKDDKNLTFNASITEEV